MTGAVQPPSPVLEVEGLSLALPRDGAVHPVLDQVSFTVGRGEVLGIAGASGSGKSQMLLALLGLSPPGARLSGSVRLEGRELVGLPQPALRDVRGARIAMVFQDPQAALNPCVSIGTQLAEVLQVHRGCSRRAALEGAAAMLDAVHLPEPHRLLRRHPHELSGGMRQRVVIAMALLCEPAVLLADEPTTALDPTVQMQILALFAEVVRSRGTSLVLVTHDLSVLAALADRVAVMERGRLVETAAAETLFASPAHEASRRLLDAARALS